MEATPLDVVSLYIPEMESIRCGFSKTLKELLESFLKISWFF
jgi:hypothetical protein